MAAQVLSLFQRLRSRDWTQSELAQFYRVEGALVQAGLQLETDRGLTDEGDPWFVFCRADDGEVFIHFARIDGAYIAVGAALEQVVHGKDFSALVEEMLAAQAFAMATRSRTQSNIFLHPAALLIALVGGAFFHSSHAKAAETADNAKPEMRRHTLPTLVSSPGSSTPGALDPAETATILSGVLITLNDPARYAWAANLSQQADPTGGALPALAAPPPLAPMLSLAGATVSTDLAPAPTTAYAAAAPHFDLARLDLSALTHMGLSSLTTSAGIVVNHAIAAGWIAPVQAAVFSAENAPAAPPNAAVLVQASTSDAAQALQAANVLSDVQVAQPLAISPFVLVPTLSGLLDQGAHFAVVPVIAVPLGPPVQNTAPATDGAGHKDGTGASAPPAPVISTPVVTPPVDSTPPPVVSTSPPVDSTPPPVVPPVATPVVTAGLSADSPQVTAAIQHFSAEVGVLDLANSAHGVVLYDGSLFTSASNIPALDSVTFNFSDGSSISLVGTYAEIQNLHLS